MYGAYPKRNRYGIGEPSMANLANTIKLFGNGLAVAVVEPLSVNRPPSAKKSNTYEPGKFASRFMSREASKRQKFQEEVARRNMTPGGIGVSNTVINSRVHPYAVLFSRKPKR